MLGRLLTDVDWRALVKDEIVPAFLAQLPPDFSQHADWTGRKLLGERWTYEQAVWCVAAVTGWRRFDNLWAMLRNARDGRIDRDGNQVGGWQQSLAWRKLCDTGKLKRCRAEKQADPGLREYDCGNSAMCHDCPDRPEVVELPGRSRRYGGGGLTTVADEVARLTEGGDDD